MTITIVLLALIAYTLIHVYRSNGKMKQHDVEIEYLVNRMNDVVAKFNKSQDEAEKIDEVTTNRFTELKKFSSNNQRACDLQCEKKTKDLKEEMNKLTERVFALEPKKKVIKKVTKKSK